jgi:hypothetical protein
MEASWDRAEIVKRTKKHAIRIILVGRTMIFGILLMFE